MADTVFRRSRWPLTAVLAAVLAACGGGGGGSPPPPPGDEVTISGRITYDFVPVAAAGGLDYNFTEPRPARLVRVQFVEDSNVLAATFTDTDGDYSLTVPANRTGFIRARAESVRSGTPGWDFSVRDNVNGDAIYTLDGAALSSGETNSVRDLHADSGWLGPGTGYGAERAAAPFAILDTVYEAGEFLVNAGAVNLPPLALHWSPENVPSPGEDGNPDPTTGEIGTSFYGVNPDLGIDGIYLLGEENSDTEEYDRHVILHELGHYLENQLGRSDSIGGPHGSGDRLDMRVAFSEGWATAFAALTLGDSVYVDTGGEGQAGSFSFDAEGPRPDPPFFETPNPAPGWYSEESVWELLYDLVDADIDGSDTLSYDFTDVWNVMTGRIVTTPALTSIFPFVNAFREDHPGDEGLIDALLAEQSIDPIMSDFGEGETNNDADSADVLPIYTELTVGGTVNVCSTDEFSGGETGAVNKLSSRRFIRFTPPTDGAVEIEVVTTVTPEPDEMSSDFGVAADPDWIIHRQGPFGISGDAPNAACQAVDNPAWQPANCVEPDPDGDNAPAIVPVINADYVLEVYEWTNTNDTDNPDYPPIGRTCFDVTVTQL